MQYRRYLEKGGNQTVGRFELMRTLLSLGQLNAQREYYAMARLDDSMVVHGLRRDFSLIAGDSGVVRFDSVGTAGREAFLRRFWTRRDRTDLRRDGSGSPNITGGCFMPSAISGEWEGSGDPRSAQHRNRRLRRLPAGATRLRCAGRDLHSAR